MEEEYKDLIERMGQMIDDYELGKVTVDIVTKENKTITISLSNDEVYVKGAIV